MYDEAVCAFFEDCGEVVGLRWLTHKDSGDFKARDYPTNYLPTSIYTN